MRKRITSALLALVMLLSLVPAMGMTASAADAESHPTKVGYISSGKYEACYIAEGGFIFAENKTGSNSEEKWNAYKSRLNTEITEDAGYISGKPIEGVAYYDSASGVLYITGNVYTIVSAVVASTAKEDVLKVVVDGNTNNDGGWCVTEINHCLDKLNIEFRNNGTLTLRKRSGNSAVLGVTGYNGQPGTINWSTDPFWFGDLELSGTGKLKINVSDDEQKLLCGIRAKDISIKDNVSLDIKMGKSNASVMYRGNAAMICKSLTINTTGTVQIDTALEGSFNRFSVFAPIADYYVYMDPVNSFNLVNAQSVTLKANVKNELFDTRFGFGGKQDNLGDRICDALETKGWTVTESAADASPYTVMMTRAAMPTAAELTVGTQTVQNTADTPVPSVTVTGGEYVSLKASAILPNWLSKMVTGSNARAKVGDWFLRIFEGEKLVGETIGGYNNSINVLELPEVSIGTTGFKPTPGKTYTVYAGIPIVATDGGKQLGSASVIATIKVVEKPISNVLSGSILYTSGVRYGADVTTARTGDMKDIASDKLHYQWQVKNGGAWTDISGATAGKLEADKVNTVVGKDIRLKITADGYEGVLYSPVKTVAKAAQTNIPVAPVLTCLVSTEPDGGAMVKLTNKQDGQEYLLSSSATTDTELAAASSDKWNDTILNYVRKGFTFYIYTRMKETDTHAAGTIYRYSTIYTGNVVDLKNLALEGYTNKIYVKKGEPLTIDVVGTPANANQWNAVYFIEQDNTASNFTVKVDNGETNFIPEGTGTGAFGNHTITITSDKVGRHTLYAFPADTYNPYATPFGRWDVVVYEDSVNINDAELINLPAYADVTLTKGDSYTPENVNPTIQTNPAGVMGNYSLKWFVMTPATGAGGTPTYSADNGYISVDENGVVTAKEPNDAVDSYKTVALCAVDKTTGSFVRHITSYKVTVKAVSETAPALESISVHPSALTLKKGDSADLTAIKNPVNAEGIVTWNSSNESVAAVDNTGKVTAVDVGTATITVTCGTKTATCTVKVVCADHTYSDTWEKLDDVNHYRACTNCGEGMESAAHTFGDWQQGDMTQHYKECSVCHHKVYANHEESAQIIDAAPTFDATGTWHTECEVCHKQMNTGAIAKLEKIAKAEITVTAPVRNAAPAWAVTKDSVETAYDVAYTEWDPEVSSTFAGGTVYTVKVELEASGSNRFTNATQFTINGQTATVVGTALTADGAETVTLTYQFPATGSGSSGGGGGSSASSYAITVQNSKNGSVTAERKTASAGATVALTVSPDKGYTLETITATDKDGKELTITKQSNGQYIFTMPASKVEVKATFMEDNTMLNFFVDVKASDYYYDAVLWAAKKGITSGTDAEHFSPNQPCTRAQIVTFLWRAAGSPEPKSASSFADVSMDSYYAKAVAWAVENGITKGTSDTTFSPDATCTRAQAVTFLYRASGSPVVSGGSAFSDVAASAYYADAVIWAEQNGITGGIGGGLFGSENDCTRAQIVTFLYRMLTK